MLLGCKTKTNDVSNVSFVPVSGESLTADVDNQRNLTQVSVNHTQHIARIQEVGTMCRMNASEWRKGDSEGRGGSSLL